MGGSLFVIFFLGNQVRIHNFLEKTKKKNALNKDLDDGSDALTKQQEKLRKKVTILMKKQRLYQVRKIVKDHDDIKPWGQEAQVKVCSVIFCCCHLILLIIVLSAVDF